MCGIKWAPKVGILKAALATGEIAYLAKGAKEKAKLFNMHTGCFRCMFSKGSSPIYSDLGVSHKGKWSSPCGPSATRGHLKDTRSIEADLLWSTKGHIYCMTHCEEVGNK